MMNQAGYVRAGHSQLFGFKEGESNDISEVGIQSLPEEIVVEIFCKFANRRDGQNVPFVCKRWNRICSGSHI